MAEKKLEALQMIYLHEAKQHVSVYRALMGFVQEYHRVLREQVVEQALSQEHPVCHVLYDGF